MIVISFLLMLVLFIIAGATQFWLLAMIGVGIFVITLLTYLMATNDIFGAIVIMLLAIGAPIIYLNTGESWILYVIYIDSVMICILILISILSYIIMKGWCTDRKRSAKKKERKNCESFSIGDNKCKT